jgi:hypothetical protein
VTGVVPDPQADPAGYVHAAADLREKRIAEYGQIAPDCFVGQYRRHVREHIAAEASPAHALAEVALWRGIVKRHVAADQVPGMSPSEPHCRQCWSGTDLVKFMYTPWPCPDLLAVVAAARAYLTGDNA